MRHIHREIRSNNYPNCSRVARIFEVSSKSIQRDIDFMRDMLHAPIEYDSRKKGYFYSEEWMFDPSAFLDQQESEALAATSRVLAQYEGTPYYDEISRAIDKVMQYLPASCSGDGLFDIYSFDIPAPLCSVDQERFSLLEQALRNRLKVFITYKASSREAMTERMVHPYRLHYDQSGGTWYLIAWCEYRSQVRTFAVCRMQQLALVEEHFDIPESFSMIDYLQNAFDQTTGPDTYDIAIRFTPYQSQWIREHRWHPTQQIHEHEDGSLTLALRVGALDAVKRWVMRYGAQAEVLQPDELREMIKMEVREMGVVYGGSTSDDGTDG
jgi:predicted DNA-binding transcriptional regulator YafY